MPDLNFLLSRAASLAPECDCWRGVLHVWIDGKCICQECGGVTDWDEDEYNECHPDLDNTEEA